MADATSSAMLGQAAGLNRNLSDLVEVMRSRFALSANAGSATWGAASTAAITDTAAKLNSLIFLMATNAGAATLEAGSKKPYVSARSAGGFTLTTADGTSATGGEEYAYLIVNAG
jgi:hypothetical protein